MDNNFYHAIKRTILIVEDNEMNREMLAEVLTEEYELILAENGRVGLELLAQHYREISLVLLDVYMPICNGFQFLEEAAKDPLLSNVPVIITTGSKVREDEVRCLKLGASDFVTKPYNFEIVLSRIHNIIKLKESVATLSAVEFDTLTGVYTMSAFYHHAVSMIQAQSEKQFDLGVFELQEFNLYNSVFGEAKGDVLLKEVAAMIRTTFPQAVIGRQWAKFYILKALQSDKVMLKAINNYRRLAEHNVLPNFRVKYGVYRNVKPGDDIRSACEKASLAALSIKDDVNKLTAEYNEEIQKKLSAQQHLEMSFDDALEKEQFVIWYQPKVDAKTGEIVGAEALVRWMEEDGHMISPVEFVPLFEKKGMIARLDRYVFQKVCQMQKERQEKGKKLVPISVNLSRNSIYNKDTSEKYHQILTEIGISPEYVPIELTESTAIDDSFIQARINTLKENGFSIHLDDFGTGYSSLSSLTKLPFDVLKLDKSLIDQIGTEDGESILECLILLSKKLKLHIVAEGVETKEQVLWLRKNQCDQIQGYYFYRPMNQTEFEKKLDC